jgi:hypothetical protein
VKATAAGTAEEKALQDTEHVSEMREMTYTSGAVPE